MKRESAAETALRRQVKILREKQTELTQARDEIQTKINILAEMIGQFLLEIDHSKALREKANEARKPNNIPRAYQRAAGDS